MKRPRALQFKAVRSKAARSKTMRLGETRYALGGAFYVMRHVEWGNPDSPPLVCVHGLTRTGRDFDGLAAGLDGYRLICPDLPGRGRSDWLPDGSLYTPGTYVVALAALLAGLDTVKWVGTSLGGICGMMIAAMPGQPISRMVLNDVGPHIPAAALARIREYIGTTPKFPTMAALQLHLRQIHAPFGTLTGKQWDHLAETSTRPVPGGFALHYDPAIAAPILATEPADVDLSILWAAITIPMLSLRGENSDLLTPDTHAAMAASGAATHTVLNTGHAPALMDAPTIAVIAEYLAD